jgi:hypothetical protein
LAHRRSLIRGLYKRICINGVFKHLINESVGLAVRLIVVVERSSNNSPPDDGAAATVKTAKAASVKARPNI